MDNSPTVAVQADEALLAIGVPREQYANGTLFARSPINGSRIGRLQEADGATADAAIARATTAAAEWRLVPLPRRTEFVRLIANELRKYQEPLARLVTIETGKTLPEGREEVRYAINRCDNAFGLLRLLFGSTTPPEMQGNRMLETWRPLGVTACISPFNQPIAQFAAHGFTTIVCGNAVVWKPSERASLSALALRTIISHAAHEFQSAPAGLVEVLFGGRDIGKLVSEDFRIGYLHATGSTWTGRTINMKLAQRFARASMQLSSSNAAVVCPTADLNVTLNSVAYGAIMEAGQSCMNIRRLLVHANLYDALISRLGRVFARMPIGNPLQDGVAMGPLVDRAAFESMQRALQEARVDRGAILGGQHLDLPDLQNAYYVRPALVEMPEQTSVVLRETLAPILYVMRINSLEEGIALNNASDAGLASCIFTRDMMEADLFLSAVGTDTGAASVNTFSTDYDLGAPTAGAKSSAGGRISGADNWRAHMRRCAIAMNMRPDVSSPLADLVVASSA